MSSRDWLHFVWCRQIPFESFYFCLDALLSRRVQEPLHDGWELVALYGDVLDLFPSLPPHRPRRLPDRCSTLHWLVISRPRSYDRLYKLIQETPVDPELGDPSSFLTSMYQCPRDPDWSCTVGRAILFFLVKNMARSPVHPI
mmetsp:Transcript_74088/g.197537  ORF Transcript_74088/g.197537 Transcript_74088/m.197537 type:complete len:142 (+) Transcript_74088:455-880(+)